MLGGLVRLILLRVFGARVLLGIAVFGWLRKMLAGRSREGSADPRGKEVSMTRDQQRYDLGSIEPIEPARDDRETQEQNGRVDRVGFVAAASAGSPPAVGVAVEPADDAEPDSATEDAEPPQAR